MAVSITVLCILCGFVLLYFGADYLVRGSSQLALQFGISHLVVGLTVVAFGTSAPELVVSITSGIKGLGDVALGNVIGSNIMNIAVILGFSAVICPIKIHKQVLRMDAPIVAVLSILLLFLLRDKTISRFEAIFLACGIITYVTFSVIYSKKHPENVVDEQLHVNKKQGLFFDVLFIVGGLGALVGGSNLFVKGAVQLAKLLHVSEAVIGLTVVAFGTSLPELATAVIAALKKQEDIAVGGIIGSNIFNILSILGFTGIITPLYGQGITIMDLSFMTGTALLLIPLMITGFKLSRIDGGILLLIYGVYMYFLWPKG